MSNWSSNRIIYDEAKRRGYKYTISYPREATHIILRPENVKMEFPDLDFFYVPMEKEFCWLFKTLNDYAIFLRHYTEQKP